MNLRLALATWILLPCLSGSTPLARAHGELDLRILAATQSIAAATNNPRLYLERAELRREHGEWQAAATDFDRAAALDPRVRGLDAGRARLLADQGQHEAALTLFDRAIAQDPAAGECYVGRARVLLRLNRSAEALEDYRHGLQLIREPQSGQVLELARLLAAARRDVDALAVLDDAIRKLGPVTSLQGYAVDLELARQANDAALARLETILARAMRKELWFARKAEILLASGKAEQAAVSYDAALAALDRLPARLQQSPGMLKLRGDIDVARARMALPVATNRLASSHPPPGPDTAFTGAAPRSRTN